MPKKNKSSLHINPGSEIPDPINKAAASRYISSKKKGHNSIQLFNQLKSNDRTALSKAITLIESTLLSDQQTAQKLIELCLPESGKSIRIGITGVPGVGKSSFIEAFGSMLTKLGHKVAVLAVDPSSTRTKGSILGDKTRMIKLSAEENAFIRPSPSAGSLGGVAQKTRESIILCEAAGFDVIIVETVGVGQSETAVYNLVDFFLLLMLPGAGDILQGIKRGIIEMSDSIFINKADGDRIKHAQTAAGEYANALHMFPPSESGWIPKTGVCSAKENTGIKEIWDIVQEYINFSKGNNYFTTKRELQDIAKMHDFLTEELKNRFLETEEMTKKLKISEDLIRNKEISPYTAAKNMLDNILSK